MSRQLRTLLLGALLVVILGTASFAIKVPYVVLSPGPTVNTLGKDNGSEIIMFKGYPESPTTGNLNLTTVSVETDRATLAGAIHGWLASDEVVVPHDSVYPPGQTEQQTNEQDKQDFLASQDSATAAAACELKQRQGFGVITVTSDSPNAGILQTGDIFVSVNGSPVSDDASLKAVLAKLSPGQAVPAVMIRRNYKVSLTLHLGTPTAGATAPRLGVEVANGCLFPFQVTLGLSGIGGPSAGLMFALGIIDKYGGADADLTGGRFIAGTGTIDPDGTVGRIGGIQLKMLGARREGATVFLAPDGNCNDVRGNIPSGLTVIKVATLHEAVTDLQELKAGRTDLPHC